MQNNNCQCLYVREGPFIFLFCIVMRIEHASTWCSENWISVVLVCLKIMKKQNPASNITSSSRNELYFAARLILNEALNFEQELYIGLVICLRKLFQYIIWCNWASCIIVIVGSSSFVKMFIGEQNCNGNRASPFPMWGIETEFRFASSAILCFVD